MTGATDTRLTAAEEARLLRLARAALEQEVTSRPVLDTMLAALEPSTALAAPRGAFVSLHRRPGKPGARAPLRGCIGLIETDRPLYRVVVDMTRAAATKDPRFEPVQEDELASLAIDVSVLTPLVPVDGPADFRPGRDGVQIELRGRRAVFLPQVAREEGWGREETLRHLCLKAGLGAGEWRSPDACFATFRAEVVSELAGPSD